MLTYAREENGSYFLLCYSGAGELESSTFFSDIIESWPPFITFHPGGPVAVVRKNSITFIFFAGVCVSFQIYWEFWYLDELRANPLVMGGAALIRRPLLAISIFTSCRVIRKIGDLHTICLSFSLFGISFFALSFTRVFWYVLAIDTMQAAGYGLAYTAFTVHLSKAGTKASSGLLLGKKFIYLYERLKYKNFSHSVHLG